MIANEDLEDVSQNLLIVNVLIFDTGGEPFKMFPTLTVTILVSPGIDPGYS